MCTYRIRGHFGPKIVARLAQATLQFEFQMAYFYSANDLVEARLSLRPVTSKFSATTVTTASAEQATAPVPGPLPVFTASAEQAQHNFGVPIRRWQWRRSPRCRVVAAAKAAAAAAVAAVREWGPVERRPHDATMPRIQC